MSVRIGRTMVSACLLASLLCTGCTSLGMKSLGGILGDDGEAVAADPASTYYVMFVPEDGRPEQMQRTLSGQMHVQDALEQAGAFKKFRRIEVELARPLPNGGMHRIPCDYDRAAKRITPEFDYALLPGDRIIVKEDPSNIVDDMLTSALGPLGSKVGKQAQGRTESGGRYRVAR